MKKNTIISIILVLFLASCSENSTKKTETVNIGNYSPTIAEVELKADFSGLSQNQKEMINLFIKISDYTDSIFFYENTENFNEIISSITDSSQLKKFCYNFGPWDRFDENKPFINNIKDKPLGGNFYPNDLTIDEFNKFDDDCKKSHYTFIRRDTDGNLVCIPYHVQFKKYIDSMSFWLNEAAELSNDSNFAYYLKERAIALQTDNYYKSDSIWLNLSDNVIDFIVGPISIYDDKLFNLKSEHQSVILIKDVEWTSKMEKYNKWLKYLQKAIPVPEEYRAEEPGEHTSIAVYNAIYYGGSGKCGGTLISVVLPIDSKTQMEQGLKNLQFKNIIENKFDVIAQPIADVIFKNEQKIYVTRDAFFVNTILYEMANSLGIRNTINNNGSVRNSLKDLYLTSEYLKNSVLSLFLAEKLYEVKEINTDLKENYFTFVVNLIRLIRFGSNSDYGTANLVCFNYLITNKAITFTKEGLIEIDYEKMKNASQELVNEIIVMQGNGDYDAMSEFINKNKTIDKNLGKLIQMVNEKNIPTDMLLIQGKDVLNL